MDNLRSEMIRNLEGVVLGEREGHIWTNEFGIPVHLYFGRPGEEIPPEKQPSTDRNLSYKGRIPIDNALEAIVAFATG